MTLPAPLAPDQLSLEWLNAIMRERELPQASDFTVHPFGELGVYGELVRIELHYPDSQQKMDLVAKFALADEASRLALAEIGVYAREYSFYTSELSFSTYLITVLLPVVIVKPRRNLESLSV